RQGDYEYLVKTQPDNRQSRMGLRSPETEKIHAEFTTRKREIEARLKSLSAAPTDAERLNKALKAGRVPSIVVSLLKTLEDAGLGQHFTVVGTHALYAYETAAGVRIVQGALATQDVDLLWDARKRVRFITDMGRLDSSMLGVLQRAYATFRRKEGQNEMAINGRGFEVDFLRRQPEGDDPHPFRFSDDEGDLWPVQAIRASVLTNAPRFEHMVISATGRMTLMRTIAPEAFVEFKRWLVRNAQQRPEPKRRRDQRQADIVQKLLDEGLLMPEAGTSF
ncbi:MAG: GSU2403 family nucleotidyltransferase fold protein, partial [Polaromonas sp.]